jgi:hypothetical protein
MCSLDVNMDVEQNRLSPSRQFLVVLFCALITTSFAGCAANSTAPPDPSEEAAKPAESTDESSQSESKTAEVEQRDLRWSRSDLATLHTQLIEQLSASELANTWKEHADSGTERKTVMVSFRNETSPKLSPQIDALASALQTDLVNDTASQVVSTHLHRDALKDTLSQYDEDDRNAALSAFGRKIGVHYIATGAVSSDVELAPTTQHINYAVSFYIIDVKTEEIAFQADLELAKPGPLEP